MPSKEAHSYNLVLHVIFSYLLDDVIFSYYQYVSIDQGLAMYHPLHAMLWKIPYMHTSRHHLDIHHWLKKEWMDRATLKVTWKEITTIIGIVLNTVIDMFDYAEAEDEMNIIIKCFKRYYAISIEKKNMNNKKLK